MKRICRKRLYVDVENGSISCPAPCIMPTQHCNLHPSAATILATEGHSTGICALTAGTGGHSHALACARNAVTAGDMSSGHRDRHPPGEVTWREWVGTDLPGQTQHSNQVSHASAMSMKTPPGEAISPAPHGTVMACRLALP